MIKVLHVLGGMNAGGMETMIMNYYRKIDKNLFQFDFLINDPNEAFYEQEINKLGGHIYRVTSQRKNIFKNHKEVDEIIKNGQYDVIHCHQGITYYYPLISAKKYKIKKRIIHNHGINKNFLKYLALYNNLYAKKRICSLATDYISCSETVLDNLFSNKIIKNKEYIILPNAIDVNDFEYSLKKRNIIRKDLCLNNKKTFIHVGTFTTPKNHEFLIDLFYNYLKIDSNSILLLVGEGPLKTEIINKVHSLKIDNNVLFLGTRKDITDLMSASDIMLFPSLYESLGIVAIESQCSGLKTIASINVPNDVNISNIITFLPYNKDLWIKEISQFENNYDRKEYNIIVSKTNFNINKSVQLLEKIYKGE